MEHITKDEKQRVLDLRARMTNNSTQTPPDKLEQELPLLKQQLKAKEIEYDTLYTYKIEKFAKEDAELSKIKVLEQR